MAKVVLLLVFLGIGVVGVLILAGVIGTDSLAERLWTGGIYTFMGIIAIAVAIKGGSSDGGSDEGGREYGVDPDAD